MSLPAQTGETNAARSSENGYEMQGIPVNNVWGGYERDDDHDVFAWRQPFWAHPAWRSTRLCARTIEQASSRPIDDCQRARAWRLRLFWAAQKYIGNEACGVAKAATDKLTADMAVELAPHDVAVVARSSCAPGRYPHRAVG